MILIIKAVGQSLNFHLFVMVIKIKVSIDNFV